MSVPAVTGAGTSEDLPGGGEMSGLRGPKEQAELEQNDGGARSWQGHEEGDQGAKAADRGRALGVQRDEGCSVGGGGSVGTDPRELPRVARGALLSFVFLGI